MRPVERISPKGYERNDARAGDAVTMAWWDAYAEHDPVAATKVLECGDKEMAVTCGCGPRWVPVRCRRRWLCDGCRRAYYGALRHRLEWALGRYPPGHFITLTVEHSGDPMVDRAAIQRGWQRWRARRYKATGKNPPYVGIWEVTPSDGGHVHLHVFYHVRGFQPWKEWRAWWVKASPARVFFVKAAYGTPEARAGYLAKYLSKGVDPNGMPAEQAYRIVSGWSKKRVYTASRGYWSGYVQCCRKCKERYRLASAWEAFDC